MVLVPEEQGQVYFPLLKFEYIYPSLDPFSELKVVRKYLIEKNFPKPSPIQAQCWPPLFAGKVNKANNLLRLVLFVYPLLITLTNPDPNPDPDPNPIPNPNP